MGTTRRGGVDRRAATLMCAGRDQQVWYSQEGAPDSKRAGGSRRHSSYGVLSCYGGAPTRRVVVSAVVPIGAAPKIGARHGRC